MGMGLRIELPTGARAAAVVVAADTPAAVVEGGAAPMTGSELDNAATDDVSAAPPPPPATGEDDDTAGDNPEGVEDGTVLPATTTEDVDAVEVGGVVSFPVPAPPPNLPAKHCVMSGTSRLAVGTRDRT